MPALARDLCWRQFDLFATSGPYDQATAKLTLQPLINLARLHTRDGNGTAAYTPQGDYVLSSKLSVLFGSQGKQTADGFLLRRHDLG